MSEPNQPYKAGSEPPNFREAECCENCKLSTYASYSTMVMHCHKYNGRVSCTRVCDDYEAE